MGIDQVEDDLGHESQAQRLAEPGDRANGEVGPATEGESRPAGAAGTAAVEDVDDREDEGSEGHREGDVGAEV
jgi:hypothetical protein